jgi:hypothetical protein
MRVAPLQSPISSVVTKGNREHHFKEDIPAVLSYRLDLPSLTRTRARIIPVGGRSSARSPLRECGEALAAHLRVRIVEFPGGTQAGSSVRVHSPASSSRFSGSDDDDDDDGRQTISRVTPSLAAQGPRSRSSSCRATAEQEGWREEKLVQTPSLVRRMMEEEWRAPPPFFGPAAMGYRRRSG